MPIIRRASIERNGRIIQLPNAIAQSCCLGVGFLYSAMATARQKIPRQPLSSYERIALAVHSQCMKKPAKQASNMAMHIFSLYSLLASFNLRLNCCCFSEFVCLFVSSPHVCFALLHFHCAANPSSAFPIYPSIHPLELSSGYMRRNLTYCVSLPFIPARPPVIRHPGLGDSIRTHLLSR